MAVKPKKETSRIFSMPKGGTDPNISIRKISNGFIVRKSWMSKGGKFMEEESYTPTEPKIESA